MATIENSKKDIAYVRKEKKADDAIIKKLEEVYGKASANRDNGYRRSKKGWECPSCGYVNFESRLACGECLDVHPQVAEGLFSLRGGAGGKGSSSKVLNLSGAASSAGTTTTTATSSSSGGGGASSSSAKRDDVLKRVPNMKQPAVSCDKFTNILQISDRCYRVANFPSQAVALGKKKALKAFWAAAAADGSSGHTAMAMKKNNDDDGDEEEDEGGEDGFATCSEGDEDRNEDGVCGGPGYLPRTGAGEVLDDYGDDDDNNTSNNGGGGGGASSSPHETNAVAIKRNSSSGEWEARVYISPLLYGFIIGKKGERLAEMQRTTNTLIRIPKGKPSSSSSSSSPSSSLVPSEDETIYVRGPDRASVAAALVSLDAIVMENKGRVGYTHFLSIPLGKSKAVRETATATMKAMMEASCGGNNNNNNIDPSLFQDPSWLHFTILMLRLHTHRDLLLAKRLLHTEVAAAARAVFGEAGGDTTSPSSSSSSSSRRVALKGINMMNDDPTAVDVLYAEPQPADRLVAFVNAVNEIFTRHGMTQRHDTSRNDKLHATIMNSKFRAAGASSSATAAEGAASPSSRVPFDASALLAAFKDAFFGDYVVNTVELSKMNGADDGAASVEARRRLTYYACEDSIEF